MERACVIGSGPNGLAAATVLAQTGIPVDIFEAEAQPGGASRTLPLTLPGFLHDFGSAVHPMAAGSPFFSSLPLASHGLQWIHGDAPLAHPLDDGSAVVLERKLSDAASALGVDGPSWHRLLAPFAEQWTAFAADALAPPFRFPRHPFLMAAFGVLGLQPATWIAANKFRSRRTRALFAGLAAHSFLALDQPLSAAFGFVLAAAAHAVGWPVPQGGSQAIPDALIAHLQSLGATLHTSSRIASLKDLPPSSLILCDLTPRQLLAIDDGRLRTPYRRSLQSFRYGPAAFKIDYALSEPAPWRAPDCRRAITLHLGGTIEEIARSEAAVAQGRAPESPFVLVAQPSLFDPTRAPAGRHTLWAYCHIPNGSPVDMTSRIDAQIERFAPGFRDCVLARHISTPATLEAMDANLVGGDINGGAISLSQFLLRPAWGTYATGVSGLYLCSSSTPPGGGVHGMCGYHAARAALRRFGSGSFSS